ncbi:MAG: hypothetical protein NT023_03970 [Armatimonadetes bacterium]|nr:hypothetical protein [Armatimonadota bacterium]
MTALPTFPPIHFASPPMEAYPLPNAAPEYVERVQRLYRERFGVELTHAEAKEFLERVMQFVYLTELEDALHPLRAEIE